MNRLNALAGTLKLLPGCPTPNIRSTRSTVARTLALGRPASSVPALLARMFANCGDSHRLAARQAIAAARALSQASDADDSLTLQIDTLREHLRRIWLDWPPVLAGSPRIASDLADLRDCPLFARGARPGEAINGMTDWMRTRVLGEEAQPWLDAWEAGPSEHLERWSRIRSTLPARLLRACRDAAKALGALPFPLHVQADDNGLSDLAAELRTNPKFALAPQWRNSHFETGPWTRLAEPFPERLNNAWLRLGTRLAEAVRLTLPDADGRSGARWLRHGACKLGNNEGLAWVEMARGLLVHHVQLDGDGNEARVLACDVIAPTEWNFHPQGPMAQAIELLRPGNVDEPSVRLLAAAYDPCVEIYLSDRTEARGA